MLYEVRYVLNSAVRGLRQALCTDRKRIDVEVDALELPPNVESIQRGPLSWLVALRHLMDRLTFAESELCEHLFRRAGLGRGDREGWLWPHDFDYAVDLMLHESNRLHDYGDAYYDAMHVLLDMLERASSV